MNTRTEKQQEYKPEDGATGLLDAPGVLSEIEQLRQKNPAVYDNLIQRLKRPGAQAVVSIPPHLIRPSQWANRHADTFRDLAFTELKESIQLRSGNTQPILVRPIENTGSSKDNPLTAEESPLYEIVAGHRRHQACRELGLPVRAIVVPAMDDLQLSQAMFDENHARAALTAWEAGTMYKQWIDAGLYSSAGKLADAIGKNKSDVTRALRLCNLPPDIVEAFDSPLSLQYKDADELEKLLEQNRDAVLKKARELSELPQRKSRAEVMRLLQQAASGTVVGSTNNPRKSTLKHKNQPVAEVQWQPDGCAKLNLSAAIPEASQSRFEADVQAAIARALRAPSRAPARSKGPSVNEKTNA